MKAGLEPDSFTLFSDSLIDFVSSEILISMLSCPHSGCHQFIFLKLDRKFSEVGFEEEDKVKLE